VFAFSGRCGRHSLTMMTMIVADELAADSSKVKIERALAPIQSTKVRSSGVPDHRGGWKYVPAASHLLSRKGGLAAILIAVGSAFFLCCPWITPVRAEIFDGSGFEAINWNMHIADAERVIGSRASRLRENTHGDYEYLRVANYQYLGCQYALLINFGPNGGTLSEIVLTHRGDVKAEMAEKSCRDGLSRLRENIGRPTSVDHGVQVWRLKTTTVTVMEGRRGELQIRYKPN